MHQENASKMSVPSVVDINVHPSIHPLVWAILRLGRIMLNPTKRLLAPRKQQAQSNRPPRPPFLLQARRFVLHGIRTARRRFERLHARGCSVVQQCVETVLPSDLLAPSVILRLTDNRYCSVSNAMGSLFASRGFLPKADKSEEKEKKEEKFLISDVFVVGVEGELKEVAQSVLTIQPSFSYTLTEINNDMRKVLDTGYFKGMVAFSALLTSDGSLVDGRKGCQPRPEVTRDGIVLYVDVDPNPEIRGIVSKGASVLPPSVFEEAVKGLLGKTFNYNEFREAMRQVNGWYESEGIIGEVTLYRLPLIAVRRVRFRSSMPILMSRTFQCSPYRNRLSIASIYGTLMPGQAKSRRRAMSKPMSFCETWAPRSAAP